MIKRQTSFSFKTKKFGFFYIVKISILITLTAFLTWYGKGKSSFIFHKYQEVTIHNSNGTLTTTFSTPHTKVPYSLLIMPDMNINKIHNDILSKKYTSELPTATSNSSLSSNIDSLKKVCSMNINGHNQSAHWEPPEHCNQNNSNKNIIREIDIPDFDAQFYSIQHGKFKILYCVEQNDTTIKHPISLKQLCENFHLFLYCGVHTKLLQSLHEHIRPYYTVISSSFHSSSPTFSNVLPLSTTYPDSIHFSLSMNNTVQLQK